MLFLVLFALGLIYVPVALRLVARGGPLRLWLGFAGVLLVLLAFALVTAHIYAVPHTLRLVLCFTGFGGSIFLLTTLFLDLNHRWHWQQSSQVLAVYGLRTL